MTKQEFLAALQQRLSGLPADDVSERLAFYGESIDDRIEDGLSEEEAVSQMGTIDSIMQQTLSEIPLSKLVKEKIKPMRRLKTWEIVMLIIGAPLWIPLSIVAFALILIFYIVLWALVICLWAIEIALWACALFGLVAAVLYMARGYAAFGIVLIGAALFLAGLSIFLFFACKAATVGTAKLARNIVHGIKRMFVGKEKTK